jgi:hypothetical protein
MTLVRRKLGVKKAARQKRCQLPPQVDGSKRTNTMRKFTAIAVALGFLTSVSLPAFATPTVNGVVKSDELSAAKKKKKKDSMEKKSSLGVTDLSAAKKKKKKDSMEKKSSLGATDLSAAKKKKKKDSMEKKSSLGATDLSAAKKKKKQPEKKSEILYRIAA